MSRTDKYERSSKWSEEDTQDSASTVTVALPRDGYWLWGGSHCKWYSWKWHAHLVYVWQHRGVLPEWAAEDADEQDPWVDLGTTESAVYGLVFKFRQAIEVLPEISNLFESPVFGGQLEMSTWTASLCKHLKLRKILVWLCRKRAKRL